MFVRAEQLLQYRIRKSSFQICMADRMGKLFRLVFLIILPKKYRQDLNIGYIDASRHQLQYALKIGSKLIFVLTNI